MLPSLPNREVRGRTALGSLVCCPRETLCKCLGTRTHSLTPQTRGPGPDEHSQVASEPSACLQLQGDRAHKILGNEVLEEGAFQSYIHRYVRLLMAE